jgi:hypothetical protein
LVVGIKGVLKIKRLWNLVGRNVAYFMAGFRTGVGEVGTFT